MIQHGSLPLADDWSVTYCEFIWVKQFVERGECSESVTWRQTHCPFEGSLRLVLRQLCGKIILKIRSILSMTLAR